MAGYDAWQAAQAGNYGEAALNGVGLLPFIPALGMMAKTARKGGKAADTAEAARMQRMAAEGMERGWFRGGPEPVGGERTGPWYTQDAEEAAGYARRFGREGDVREYAIPDSNFFDANKSYPPRFSEDMAKMLEGPYYGKEGADIAKQLRKYYVDTGQRIDGVEMWRALESRFGRDGAAEVMESLGKFSGAKGITHGPEAFVFKSSPVRDANMGQFLDMGTSSIYGRADPALLGLIGGGGLLGLTGLSAARRNSRDGE